MRAVLPLDAAIWTIPSSNLTKSPWSLLPLFAVQSLAETGGIISTLIVTRRKNVVLWLKIRIILGN